MLYELRTYYIAPGRMPDQHARFFGSLPPLFHRHGIVPDWSGELSAGPGSPAFLYLMSFRDYAHRESAWAAFYADPEWASVRATTNAGSELVETYDLTFLKRNSAWTPSEEPAGSGGAVHELVVHHVAAGQAQPATEFLRSASLPAVREAGAMVLGVYDHASGMGLPKIMEHLSWRDGAQREQGWRAYRGDAQVADALAKQVAQAGRHAMPRHDAILLRPVAAPSP